MLLFLDTFEEGLAVLCPPLPKPARQRRLLALHEAPDGQGRPIPRILFFRPRPLVESMEVAVHMFQHPAILIDEPAPDFPAELELIGDALLVAAIQEDGEQVLGAQPAKSC